MAFWGTAARGPGQLVPGDRTGLSGDWALNCPEIVRSCLDAERREKPVSPVRRPAVAGTRIYSDLKPLHEACLHPNTKRTLGAETPTNEGGSECARNLLPDRGLSDTAVSRLDARGPYLKEVHVLRVLPTRADAL